MAALCCPTTIIVSGKLSSRIKTAGQLPRINPFKNRKRLITERRNLIVKSIIEDREAVDVKNDNFKPEEEQTEDTDRLMSRGINAAIVLAAGTVAVTKLLTIDHDYWQVSLGFFFRSCGGLILLFLQSLLLYGIIPKLM